MSAQALNAILIHISDHECTNSRPRTRRMCAGIRGCVQRDMYYTAIDMYYTATDMYYIDP